MYLILAPMAYGGAKVCYRMDNSTPYLQVHSICLLSNYLSLVQW